MRKLKRHSAANASSSASNKDSLFHIRIQLKIAQTLA
jgi:hypothetical protein